MLEEKLQKLSSKESLDGSDAFTLLQLIQEHTTPILSLRSVGSSPKSSTSTMSRRRLDGATLGRIVKKTDKPQRASSKRALFGGASLSSDTVSLSLPAKDSARSQVLDVHSLEEFPPMQPATTIRKKDKKSKKPRRITLTPLHHQSHTPHQLHHFTPPLATTHTSSHPAFEVEPTSCPPSHLREERRLLRSVRSKQTEKGSGDSGVNPALDVSQGSSNYWWSSTRGNSASNHTSGIAGVASSKAADESLSNADTTLSKKVSFTGLSDPVQLGTTEEGCTALTSTPLPVVAGPTSIPPLVASTPSLVAGPTSTPSLVAGPTSILSLVASTPSLMAGPTSTPSSTVSPVAGLTSTPSLVASTPSLVASTVSPVAGLTQCTVSPDRVSNRETLDKLSHLYSKMITERLVPNIVSEIHFIVRLLTCTQSAHQNLPGSDEVLDSVDNCVYFAVRVLHQIRSILTALDRATLELLCENIRIREFEPQLATFLSRALKEALEEAHMEAGTREYRFSTQGTFCRVPFQEDSDNIKNFSNMKVFHAFKKQRDIFYLIMHEWEVNRTVPNWNFQSALKIKIRSLMDQPPELCSLDHLAKLFQKQLLESCGYAARVSAGMDGLIEGPLKNLDPDKLMRLSERFRQQSHASNETSQSPSFSEPEQFFTAFIATADSYVFNHYLSLVLHHELLTLHSRCWSVSIKEVPELLHAMRVMAKFLGYLDFLPYSTVLSSPVLPIRTISPRVGLVSKCVSEAVERQHLSLTIPWAVDYMSMMDSHALKVPNYLSLLSQMITVYRSVQVEGERITTDEFMVLTSLGWLLEIPNVPDSVFFNFLKTDQAQSCHIHRGAQSNRVTRELLYVCCPYLASIRITLAEFAAGLQSRTSPIRKIKPIPAEPFTYTSPFSQLQVNLRDNFFRCHPPLLKQLCDTVSERVAETGIQLFQSQVIPEHVRKGLRVLATCISEKCSAGSNLRLNIKGLFHKNETVRMVAQVSEQTFSSALREATQFCQQHCEINTERAISSLLCETISKQVNAVAVGISTDWAMDHCMKWLHTDLRGVVFQEISRGFEKLRKPVKKGCIARVSQQLPASSPDTSATRTDSHQMSGQKHSRPQLDTVSSRQPPPCPSVSERLDESAPSCSHTSTNGTSCRLSHFTELASSTMCESHNATSTDTVQRIVDAISGLSDFIISEVTVVGGGYSPHLLPRNVGNLLTISLNLATLFVAHGLLHDNNTAGHVFLKQIASLWSLLKTLKQEIPVYVLMSKVAFTRYIEQPGKGTESVWNSLTCLLTEIISLGVVLPDIIEALWMCRIKQSPTDQRQEVMNGAAVFLAAWYSHDQMEKGEPRLREACFVRLLGIVVGESDSTSIDSLKNHPSLVLLSLNQD